jgi:phosphate transport system permease protein
MSLTRQTVEARAPLEGSRRARLGDVLTRRVVAIAAMGVLALLLLIIIVLATGGAKALHRFGFGFFTSTKWIPTEEIFGAAPYIFGTLVTSAIALVLAVPVAVGLSLFVTEACPKPLRTAIAVLSDMLAAIPSVVYGLWGIFVMVPWMGNTLEPFLGRTIGKIPGLGGLFHGNPNGGYNIFTAGVILAVMILPIISSISREVLSAVPRELRDGAYALGATRYEVVRGVTLPFARAGVVGASVLGLGRALGETIAVSMVIGGFNGRIGFSLFHSGDSIPSLIASNFNEATGPGLQRSTLVALALILVVISLGFAALARTLVRRANRQMRASFARAAA